jgi:predicted P-loop ATPase
LEGPEGKGKSTVLSVLGGEGNFSDQTLLGLDDRQQQEQIEGVWIYEIADLAGMSKADVDKTKAFASRGEDRARPAYGRHKVSQPRRCVFFATTNEAEYLKSQTGNRRFWPVRTGANDVAGFTAVRDQLWAEAAHLEAQGASLVLPEALWGAAADEQEQRLEKDPWFDILENLNEVVNVVHTKGNIEYVLSEIVFACLKIPIDKHSAGLAKRVKHTMEKLGWKYEANKLTLNGRRGRGYSRTIKP